jgi:hypothetical protein
MDKDGLPKPITRDDTEYGVRYYSEKDVMFMLEVARMVQQSEDATIVEKRGMQGYGTEAIAAELRARCNNG